MIEIIRDYIRGVTAFSEPAEFLPQKIIFDAFPSEKLFKIFFYENRDPAPRETSHVYHCLNIIGMKDLNEIFLASPVGSEGIDLIHAEAFTEKLSEGLFRGIKCPRESSMLSSRHVSGYQASMFSSDAGDKSPLRPFGKKGQRGIETKEKELFKELI